MASSAQTAALATRSCNGHTVHTGVARDLPRVAISLRYLPKDESRSLVSVKPGFEDHDRESLQDAPWRDYSSGRTTCVQDMAKAMPHLTQPGMEKELAKQACAQCSANAMFLCDPPDLLVDLEYARV